jgi:hypothetical protein
MVSPIIKRYQEHLEEEEEQTSLVLSVQIFHGMQETILHLYWQVVPGEPVTFSQLSVNCFSMSILTETDLLQALATLTHESTVADCRQVLQRLGFTPMS